MERLYKDMTLKGNTLVAKNYGEYLWNEWLKRRTIVEALGRAKAISTADALTPLVSAQCAEGQFREILQPAVARALAEMKAGTTAKQQGLTALEWRDKGAALVKSGRPQEALPCLDKALAIDSKDAGTWTSKAVALTQLNRPQEAIQCCDKALAIDPKNEYAQQLKRIISASK